MFTGMHLVVGGFHKGDAGIHLIDQHLARHSYTSEVLADRGYSYCTPARWAHPVRARRLEPVIDLHPNQRGAHPRPNDGTVIIDGTVFTDALPHPLRDLPGMRAEEKAKLRARYEQRTVWSTNACAVDCAPGTPNANSPTPGPHSQTKSRSSLPYPDQAPAPGAAPPSAPHSSTAPHPADTFRNPHHQHPHKIPNTRKTPSPDESELGVL